MIEKISAPEVRYGFRTIRTFEGKNYHLAIQEESHNSSVQKFIIVRIQMDVKILISAMISYHRDLPELFGIAQYEEIEGGGDLFFLQDLNTLKFTGISQQFGPLSPKTVREIIGSDLEENGVSLKFGLS